MGQALPPWQDAGEEEMVTQGPPQRTGCANPAAAMLRALLLALLWRGSLAHVPGYSLTVPQSVSVQEGLCVLVPCNFTYPAWYDTENPQAQLYGHWYKGSADTGRDPPVASSDPIRGVSQETRARFRLVGDPAHGDCSLQIDDARQTDAGSYFLRVERGTFKYSYRVRSSYTEPRISVLTLEMTLQITVSRANRSDPQLFPELSTPVVNGLRLTAREGDSLRFLCSIASRSPATLAWLRGGRAINDTISVGDNQLQLKLRNVTAEDGGLYRCQAWSRESSVQGSFQLLVEYSPRLGTRLNSSCQRQGPRVSCSCSLRSHPLPRLQWQVDGEAWAGNDSRGALQVSSWADGDEAISTLNWTGSGDSGPRIFCLGSNPYGIYAALHFDLSPLGAAPRGSRTRAFIEISCKLVFVATGFLLAYYLTLLYYRRTPCCCHGRRKKYRPETLAAAACLPASPSRLE